MGLWLLRGGRGCVLGRRWGGGIGRCMWCWGGGRGMGGVMGDRGRGKGRWEVDFRGLGWGDLGVMGEGLLRVCWWSGIGGFGWVRELW